MLIDYLRVLNGFGNMVTLAWRGRKLKEHCSMDLVW